MIMEQQTTNAKSWKMRLKSDYNSHPESRDENQSELLKQRKTNFEDQLVPLL